MREIKKDDKKETRKSQSAMKPRPGLQLKSLNSSQMGERTMDNTRYGTTPKGIAGDFGAIKQVFNFK